MFVDRFLRRGGGQKCSWIGFSGVTKVRNVRGSSLLPGEVAVVAASGELSIAGGPGLGAAGQTVPRVKVLASAVLSGR